MHTFSFYRAPISNCVPCRSIGAEQLYKYLTWDGCRERTEKFRKLSLDERKRQKPLLFDYVTTGGEFIKRTLDGLRSVSGYVILDFDHLDPHGVGLFCSFYLPVILYFTSPSAHGVKVLLDYSAIFDLFGLFQLDYTKDANRQYAARIYAEYWAISERVIKDQSGGQYVADASGRDITRACFLPYDSEAMIFDREVSFSKN